MQGKQKLEKAVERLGFLAFTLCFYHENMPGLTW